MTDPLHESYRACEEVARREAANFYPAFRILPREQRLAMCALYTFMRIADDLGDDDGPIDQKAKNLDDWRRGMHDALAGNPTHPSHAALVDTLRTFAIPVQYLDDVIDGVAMDLGPVRYQTWDELKVYCYRVASAVGLACIHIWKFTDAAATSFAELAGYAFQLTNILRDVKEDAERGRVYLPAEEMDRFGVTFEDLRAGKLDRRFRDLMKFEADRAREFYEASQPLAPLLPPPGRAVFLMMSRTYRQLLDEIAARDYDVFSQRVRVSKWKKLQFALSVLPVRLNWR
jgi:phytoene synthase